MNLTPPTPPVSPLGEMPATDWILDTLPWAVLVLDEQHVVRRINQLAAQWGEVTPAAVVGRPLAAAGLLPALSAALLRLLEPTKSELVEVYLPLHEQWLALSATRQPAEGWVVYGQDITPQKQGEQQYQALAENTPDLLTRWTPDLCLRYANSAFAAQVEQPLATLLGCTFAELPVPAEVADSYLATLQRVFATGQPQEHSYTWPTPHGGVAYHARLVPELHDGRVETVLGIDRDITELLRAQADALRQQEALVLQTTDKYHALFYSMDQGFCLLDVLFDDTGQQAVDYRYLELNPMFTQQSGMPAEVLGKTIRELIPDLEPFWFDLFGRVARTGESVRVERYVPQLGRWSDVHAFRPGPPAGQQVAVLFTDITARKQAEEQLRRAAAADALRLQLADVLRPLTDPAAVQAAVTHTARLHFGADRCYYCEIEAGQALIRRDAATAGLPSVSGTYSLADFTLLQAVIEAGQPFTVPDVRQAATVDDNLRQLCVQLQVISYLDVPVLKNGQAVGVLCLVQSTPREWTAVEMELATEVAERTWAAVERVRIEEALRASEEQFRTVANLVPDLLWRSSATSDATWYSHQWYEYTGQTPTDAVGSGWTDVIHPEDQAESSRRYQVAVADSQPFYQEHRIRSAQGEYRWFQVHTRPVRDRHGEVSAWFGAATDIHAHKLMELHLRSEAELEERYRAQLEQQVAERTQQLRDSRDLLQSVLNAGLVAVAVFRTVRTAAGAVDDFVLTLVNKEQEHLSGRTDLVGQYYTQLYPGIKQVGIWENLLQVVATGQPHREELYYPYEGFNRWFEYQFVPLGDGIVATTLDITARKEAEAKAQHQRQQQLEAVLEGQEEERQRIAESLHNGIGQVLYATKLRLEQLPPRPDEPGWAEVKHQLSEAINQTRTVSHELAPERLANFSLKAVLQTICQQLNTPDLRWNCYIDLSESPTLPVWLQQTMYRLAQGLAHNVAKHAQASQATIEVFTLPGWLVLYLEDNGLGFDLTAVREGLGLRTLRSRVALLGGTVQIQSAPGQGTNISVRLPLVTDQPTAEEKP